MTAAALCGNFAATRAVEEPSGEVSAQTLVKTCQVHIWKQYRSLPPRIHEVSSGSTRVSFLTISINPCPCGVAMRTCAFHVFASSSSQNGAEGLTWSRELWKIRLLPASVISTTLTLVLSNTENQWAPLGCVASQVFHWPM